MVSSSEPTGLDTDNKARIIQAQLGQWFNYGCRLTWMHRIMIARKSDFYRTEFPLRHRTEVGVNPVNIQTHAPSMGQTSSKMELV